MIIAAKGARGICTVVGHWAVSRAVTFCQQAACALLTSGRNFTPERKSKEVPFLVLTDSQVMVAQCCVLRRILRLSVGLVGKNAVL